MRYILSAFLVLMLAGASFAGSVAAPETPAILVDGNGNDTRTHPLPVTGDLGVEIGSITVDVFPVYSDASGNPATATVDANNRAVINIGSDSVGIKTSVDTVNASVGTVKTSVDTVNTSVGTVKTSVDTVNTSVGTVKTSVDSVKSSVDLTTAAVSSSTLPANEVSTQTITLVANTSQEITSLLPAAKTREWICISAMDSEKDFWVQFGSAAAINSSRLVHEWASFPITEAVSVHVIASEAFDLYICEGGK